MKARLFLAWLAIAPFLGLFGCASVNVRALEDSGVELGAYLVLRNNPADIAPAEATAAALAQGNLGPLTLAGVSSAVALYGQKNGLSATAQQGLEAAFAAAIENYLTDTGETSLSGDPNASAFITSLANAITAGAQLAAANPK